ncbi:MAG TPA: M3 family metallopeptidase, partial [Kofleriaceae bacterium]
MQRRNFLFASASAAVLWTFRSQLSLAKGEAVTKLPPLLAPFPGPKGGMPPFDKFKTEDFMPAIKQAMDLMRGEIDTIAAEKKPATFANTIEAFENAGRPFNRVNVILGIYTSTMSDKPMQKLEEDTAPILAAFSDEIIQNEALFARIKAVWDARDSLKLKPDQARLLEVTYQRFARRGAALSAADKKKLADINAKLATLYTKFGQNQLKDEENDIIVLDKAEDMAGMPDELIEAAKQTADAKKKPGKYVIANTRSSAEPFLMYASRRDLREKVWRMWMSRGEKTNGPVIADILELRAQRAKLLGFASHAHWTIDDNMAKTPDAALALAMRVWKASVARVKEEVADMQKIADDEKAKLKIEAWDYRYYAEKVRKAKYDLDQNEAKPYLQADKLREGMFWAADQLFGLKWTPIANVPVYHPDVKVWEVTRNGAHVGLWYFDPYARDGKRSGAWMNEYRTQE